MDQDEPSSNEPPPRSPSPPPRAEAATEGDPERTHPTRAPEIDLLDATGSLTPERTAWIIDHARLALAERAAGGEIRVRVVGDAEMTRHHAETLDDPTTTDVLTFDLRDEPGDPSEPLDTDLIVCIDEAERRAADLNHAADHELLLYIIHGGLHCLGFDDKDPQAAARMHAEEDRLLTAIGIGPVYATVDAEGRATR